MATLYRRFYYTKRRKNGYYKSHNNNVSRCCIPITKSMHKKALHKITVESQPKPKEKKIAKNS
jgi:hypothetical protein